MCQRFFTKNLKKLYQMNNFKFKNNLKTFVCAYIAHGKFQKASFNSNRDIRQNIGGDGDGPQKQYLPLFFKNGQEVKNFVANFCTVLCILV